MRTTRVETRVFRRAALGTAVAAAVSLSLVIPARAMVSESSESANRADVQQDAAQQQQGGSAGAGAQSDATAADNGPSGEAADPMEIGTRVDTATAMSYGSAERRLEIDHPGATYIKVGFDDLKLAEGDYLTVSDPDGEQVYTYHGDPRDGADAEGDDGFTRHDEGLGALAIQGDTAVVELHSETGTTSALADELDQQGYGVEINGFWRGYDSAELAEANPLSICGEDARKDAVCYQESHPDEYESARPIARMVVDGTVGCTAWRVGDSNTMLTNNHCVESQEEIAASESQFDYECATCGGEDPKNPTAVAGDEMLATDAELDYTLYSLDDLASVEEFGTLYLETREATQGEEIFVAGHGDTLPKRLSIFEEPDEEDRCTITEADSGDGVNLGYSCDTSGGNSGSPVIAADTGRVIALHHLGGCPDRLNYGTRMALIYPEIEELVDNGSEVAPTG